MLQNISSACFCGGGGEGKCCGGTGGCGGCGGGDGGVTIIGVVDFGEPSQDETILPMLSVKEPAKMIIRSIINHKNPNPHNDNSNNRMPDPDLPT